MTRLNTHIDLVPGSNKTAVGQGTRQYIRFLPRLDRRNREGTDSHRTVRIHNLGVGIRAGGGAATPVMPGIQNPAVRQFRRTRAARMLAELGRRANIVAVGIINLGIGIMIAGQNAPAQHISPIRQGRHIRVIGTAAASNLRSITDSLDRCAIILELAHIDPCRAIKPGIRPADHKVAIRKHRDRDIRLILKDPVAYLELIARRLAIRAIQLTIYTPAVTVLAVRLPHNHMATRERWMISCKGRHSRFRLVKRNLGVDLMVNCRIVNRRWWRLWFRFRHRRDRINIQHTRFDVITVAIAAVGLPGHDNLAVCVQSQVDIRLRTCSLIVNDKFIPDLDSLCINTLSIKIAISTFPGNQESTVTEPKNLWLELPFACNRSAGDGKLRCRG